MVRGPAEHDEVLVETGARIFLDTYAASYLDDKVLDAQVDEQVRLTSMLGAQNHGGVGPEA